MGTNSKNYFLIYFNLYQYFTKVSPDFANVNRYQVFYLQALKEMKDHSYFEMTTHQFLVVAQKTF